MSGHSKWSTIKRKKESKDIQKGKVFGRISREITIAARAGGGIDPNLNARLRVALQNARHANLPKSGIEKALNKAAGNQEDSYQELIYEGYGPAGVAIYLEASSDNTNRTLSNVRHIFSKYNGSLGNKGSLGFIFASTSVFLLAVPCVRLEEEEALYLGLVDAGVTDIVEAEDNAEASEVRGPLEAFGKIQACVEQLGIELLRADVVQLPQHVEAVSEQVMGQVMRLIDALDADEDVQRVFHNMVPAA